MVEMMDRTGKPRRVEEIERALYIVKQRLVVDLGGQKDIELFMELMTIKDCLEELLTIRKQQVN